MKKLNKTFLHTAFETTDRIVSKMLLLVVLGFTLYLISNAFHIEW